MDFAVRVLVLLNGLGNALGQPMLCPLGVIPESVGAILAAIATGFGTLLIFKLTSNQPAIRRARNRMKAELLAQSLFTDDILVTLQSQFAFVSSALRVVTFAIVPMLVMLVPVSLLLGQLSLWWQARPLRVNDDAVVTLTLNSGTAAEWPEVRLEPTSAIDTILGPVRIRSQRAICWNVRAREPGSHRLQFSVDGQQFDKELSIGNGLMRVSVQRPGSNLQEILLHPAEIPFAAKSPVKSIEIQYPASTSWMTGRDWWLVFWFAGSTVAALIFSRMINVEL